MKTWRLCVVTAGGSAGALAACSLVAHLLLQLQLPNSYITASVSAGETMSMKGNEQDCVYVSRQSYFTVTLPYRGLISHLVHACLHSSSTSVCQQHQFPLTSLSAITFFSFAVRWPLPLSLPGQRAGRAVALASAWAGGHGRQVMLQ